MLYPTSDEISIVEVKTCTMCGEDKLISQFRAQKQRSKNGTKMYTRPYCMTCEAIEVRRQYLIGCEDSPERQQELDKINELYRLRKEAGLNTFGTRKVRRGAVTDVIEAQLEKLRPHE